MLLNKIQLYYKKTLDDCKSEDTCASSEEKMTFNIEIDCENWFFCKKKLGKYLDLSEVLKKNLI